MDAAVALVRAYLQLNGYFTLCEHPVLAERRGDVSEATDLDVLAIRFPGSRAAVACGARARDLSDAVGAVDPALGAATDRPDMIIGEVKEGRPVLNGGARSSGVLAVALRRFGCSGDHDIRATVRTLVETGSVLTPVGHRVRLVAFGLPDGDSTTARGFHVVSLDSVVRFLHSFASKNWALVRRAPWKDPVIAGFVLLEKIARSRTRTPQAQRVSRAQEDLR